MTMFKTAVIQVNAQDSKEKNLKKISQLVGQASHQGAQLIALPETFNFRGPAELAIKNAENFDDDITVNLIKNLAKQYHHDQECMALPCFITNRNTRRNYWMEMFGSHPIQQFI